MGFWDDITGQTASDTSQRAADDTYRKQLAAGGELRGYGDQYLSGYEGLSKRYDPWVGAGKGALERMMLGLGLGPGDPNDFTAAYRATPGYQAAMDAGLKAVDRTSAASGRYNSGAALMALQNRGRDIEDQHVGDYFDRLGGVSQQGLGATQAQVGTIGQGLEGQRALRTAAYGGDYGAAGTVGQGMVAGAQARQQGLTNLLGMGTQLLGAGIGGYFGGGSRNGTQRNTVPGRGPYPSGFFG